ASLSVDDGWEIPTVPVAAPEPDRPEPTTRADPEPRPPWWAFWIWIARWFRAWRARETLEIPVAAKPAALPPQPQPARAKQRAVTPRPMPVDPHATFVAEVRRLHADP